MKRPRILLMDDEPDIQEVISELLRLHGYDVVCVKNGEEAIAGYRDALESEHPYSAVILDLSIEQGMGGKDAIVKLLQVDPDVRSVVSSGLTNEPAMIDFRQYGFSARLEKPYRVEQMVATLQSLINS